MLAEISQVQKNKGCVFSHMWKIDSKHKCIHTKKHDHIYTHLYVEHICNSGTIDYMALGKGKKRIIRDFLSRVTPYLPSRRLTQDHRAEHIRETQDWQGQQ
jgi:6-phosphogluconolactonase/glucosamine-6-phosphate isomerase/deaminase